MRPRFSVASFEPSTPATAALSRWTHRVGCQSRPLTPTWNAIGLSLPVALSGTVEIGSLSPWPSTSPVTPEACLRHDEGRGNRVQARRDQVEIISSTAASS